VTRPLVAYVGLALWALVACSNGDDAPAPGPLTPASESSPTDPATGSESEGAGAAEGTAAAAAPAAAALAPSPGCGSPGEHVLLKLGVDASGRAPACFRPGDFDVRFAPAIPADVTMIGPTDDGYCAVDVLVPKGAQTGAVKVTAGDGLFESPGAFHVPCDTLPATK
jgi:hypothetical protein